jgi:transposase InsO family protein
MDVLSDLFILRGIPGHVRSDNGPEFVAKAVQEWITMALSLRATRIVRHSWVNSSITRSRRQDCLHRARQPLGERPRRELQRAAT